MRRVFVAVVFAVAAGSSRPVPAGAEAGGPSKLDSLLQHRVLQPGRSSVIVQGAGPQALPGLLPALQLLGGRVVRPLPVIDAVTIDLPNAALSALAGVSAVSHLSLDRAINGSMERTGATVGATAVRSRLGLDGAGVGVAIIDSGITAWHDDLGSAGGQRVDRFVDFTAGRSDPYDDFGHGTHVAGIVAGNGADSGGARTGIAPAAHLTILKVLDGNGHGRISDVIAALGYLVTNKDVLGIRVVNLSVATGVYESCLTDPLTLAARRAVEAGIVVVAAAGNNGRSRQGDVQYGGITAPGNAPWVLTVGASSHMGTADRGDDTIAAFSSRGPSAVDYAAKPDLVSPGVGVESLSDPGSALYAAHPAALLDGTVATGYEPYMSLSGTSMSAPVVTGTVALMLQANPALTPNAVKAILQFTAQTYAGYDPLTQGAGFLNADGAVSLAAWYAAPLTTPYPDASAWSGHVIWGNRLLDGPGVAPDMIPWAAGVVWGDPLEGVATSLNNVVWGTLCGGADCPSAWNAHAVISTSDQESDTVVWGTGTGESDTVVWGTSDQESDTVVWGTSCSDPSCDTVVWGRQ
jgi:serine protease AprX